MNSIGWMLFSIFFAAILISAFKMIIIYRSNLRIILWAFKKKSASFFSTIRTFVFNATQSYQLRFKLCVLLIENYYLRFMICIVTFRNFIFSFHFLCFFKYIVDSVYSFVKCVIPFTCKQNAQISAGGFNLPIPVRNQTFLMGPIWTCHKKPLRTPR